MATTISFHVLAGSISVAIIVILGILIYLRNPQSNVNGLLGAMFILLGIYQFLDVLIQFLDDLSEEFLNIVRDFAVLFLIFGITSGIVAAGLIFYGKNIVFFDYKFLAIVGIVDVVLFILTIFNEHVVIADAGHDHSHVAFTRNLFGWIGILGILIGLMAFIGYMLAQTYRTIPTTDKKFKAKILKLFNGLTLSIIVILAFEISLALELVSNILENEIIHIVTHSIAVIGELLVLNAFWNPFEYIKSSAE